jgi:hypothetical protein
MYRILEDGSIQNKITGACFPDSADNRDYKKYSAWVMQGNHADPYVAPLPSEISPGVNEILDALMDGGQKLVAVKSRVAAIRAK